MAVQRYPTVGYNYASKTFCYFCKVVRLLDFPIKRKEEVSRIYLCSLGCVQQKNRKRSKPEAKNREMLAPFVQVVDEKLEQFCGIPIET